MQPPHTASLLALVALLLCRVQAVQPTCPIVLDGRIPSTTTNPSVFDTPSSPFNPDVVKGSNVKFSQIIRLPSVEPSRFDLAGGKAISVSISDKSVFKPGSGAPQTGFRRVGLLLARNSGTDASTTGVKTFHWSVRLDASKPLNLTHEYLNVWHERNDYAGNQFNFQTGALIGRERDGERGEWKITDRKDKVVWRVKQAAGWQNFALTLDYGKNTMQVYYSAGNAALAPVTAALQNDNSGGGQFQVGILKKPTGAKDVVHDGFQEANFEERLVYGGIFVEDSAGKCVSL